jgi:hypothetical protein
MSRSFRRYEILLPLRVNDGQPVPDDLVANTLLELERRFGAVSSETQTIRGLCRHEGESYRADLIRVGDSHLTLSPRPSPTHRVESRRAGARGTYVYQRRRRG